MKLKHVIIIFFLLASLASRSQIIIYPNGGIYGVGYNRIVSLNTLWIPTGCGVPSGSGSLNAPGTNPRQAAVFADTCGHHLYWYQPNSGSWARIDTGGGGGGGGTVTGVLVSGDTLYYTTSSGNSFVAVILQQFDSLTKYVTPTQLTLYRLVSDSSGNTSPISRGASFKSLDSAIAAIPHPALTFGVGLKSGSFNGTTAVTVNVDTLVGVTRNTLDSALASLPGLGNDRQGNPASDSVLVPSTNEILAKSIMDSAGAGMTITDLSDAHTIRHLFTATGGGGAVSSVSNSDGSLTVSPTTGSVVASLNVTNPNTWTGLQTFNSGLAMASDITFSGTTATHHIGSSGNLALQAWSRNFLSDGLLNLQGGSGASVVLSNITRGSATPLLTMLSTGQAQFNTYISSSAFTGGTPTALFGTDASGAAWPIAVGTGLSFTGQTLNSTGGGGTVTGVFKQSDTVKYATSSGNNVGYINPEVLGSLYNNNSWSAVSGDWTVTGATAAISANKITVSGGSGASFTNYLSLTAYGETGLEHWHFYTRVKLTSKNATATDGFGIGLQGPYWNAIARFFQTATSDSGQVAWYFPQNLINNTLVVTSSGNLSFNVNDLVSVTAERALDGFTVTATDVTNGSTTTTTATWTLNVGENSAAYTSVGTGNFSFYTFGGTQTIDSVSIYSNEEMYADQLIIGDSKTEITHSNDASLSGAYGALVRRKYPHTIIIAGQNNTGVDAINLLHEVLALHPANVLVNIGRNQISTANANNDTIYNRLSANGINTIFLLPFYETTINQTSLVTHLETTYPNNFIDTYDPTITYNVSIHPTPQMQSAIADVIVNSRKLNGLNKSSEIGSGGQIPFGNQYSSLKSMPYFNFNELDTSEHIGNNVLLGSNSAGFGQVNLYNSGPTLTSTPTTYNILGGPSLLTLNTTSSGTLNLSLGTAAKVSLTSSLLSITPITAFGNYLYIADGFAYTWTSNAKPGIYGSNAKSRIDFLTTGAIDRVRIDSNDNLVVGRMFGTVTGPTLTDGRRFQDSGTASFYDTVVLANIKYRPLDSVNTKPMVVDASGNTWKTDWPTFGSGGSTPTLQQVLTAGSTLSAANTIALGTNNLNISGSGGGFVNFTSVKTGIGSILGNSSTPTLTAGSGAGTSPTIVISGTNICGTITIIPGTGASGTNAIIATLTMANSAGFANSPILTLQPANAATALLSGATMVYSSQNVTNPGTSVDIKAGTTGLTPATFYQWNYLLMGF
jgi:hypothetical protein